MKNYFQKLINTDNKNFGLLITRVVLGIVILPHGLQKLLGMFGGNGFTGTMDFMTGMGLPAVIALLVILGESLGALALIFGFISRFMAFGIFVIMTGAMFMAHLSNGFFIDWFGAGTGNGIEFHLLTIAMAFVIMLQWAGALSIDNLIKKYCLKK